MLLLTNLLLSLFFALAFAQDILINLDGKKLSSISLDEIKQMESTHLEHFSSTIMRAEAYKGISTIRLLEKQPVGSWEQSQPSEYGFYSNVNPEVSHPRWSQATERRIGEDGVFSPKRKTLMLNGYANEVGSLYAGMDLRKNY